MQPLDYGRSFLIGKAPENEVRFWVESRTRIADARTGVAEDYLQAGSCKSERTFAERDLFMADNYDFLPVFGPQWGVIFRRKAHLNPGYRSVVPAAQMWQGQVCHLVEAARAEQLGSPAAVRAATYAFLPLVAQCAFEVPDPGLQVVVEFPVKTMNTHRARDLYQVDSGPVVVPDLWRAHPRWADGLTLAFVAFNRPDFADLVLEVPTAVAGESGPLVHHYAQTATVASQNRLFALHPGAAP